MIVQVDIFNSQFQPTETTFCSDFSLSMDYLSNETSTFSLTGVKIDLQSYVAIKVKGSGNSLYFGYVDSIDTTTDSNVITVTTKYIYGLLDGDIIVTNKSGNSYESHLVNLLKMFIKQNNATIFDAGSIASTSSTPYSVSISENITTTSFLTYLIRGLKLHAVTFKVDGLAVNKSTDIPVYHPNIVVGKSTQTTLNLTDKDSHLVNWSVQDSRLNRGYTNCLKIIDQASKDMEVPNVLATYYLTTDGQVTATLNDNVIQPCKVSVYLYDSTQSDKPSYLSVAQGSLTGNNYSHLIQVDMTEGQESIDFEHLTIGTLANIRYKETSYQSILTGFTCSGTSQTVTLLFGNIRNNLKDLLEDI